jgi:FixJ family two-component response regulator/DNA-binding MarR family transcriptional regulator
MQAEAKQRQHTVLSLVREPDGFAEVPALLARDGFRVASPQSLEEAGRMVAQRSDVGIVLADIVWKNVRGADIYHHLQKSLPPSRSLCVIFLAEAASINDVVAALRLQAVDFLHKPSNPRVLLEAVRRADRLLSRRDVERVMTRRAAELLEVTRAMIDLLPTQSNPEDAPGDAELPASYDQMMALSADTEEAVALGRSKRNLRKVMSAMKVQKLQRRIFGDALVANPCWDMLLDLYEKKTLGRVVSVSSLCIAAGVPATTALRRIDILEEQGLILRSEDNADGRRVLVELAPAGAEKLAEYFESID